jgi:CheY-like chemotaxis protein
MSMNWEERLILIAEDNDDDYFLWDRALRKAQVVNPVRRVKNGQEVVEYLSGAAPYSDRAAYPFPYFLLLDLKMPVKHGFDTLAWIRQREATKLLPVVIFSSSQQTADIRRGYELGANGFVTKSTSVEGLVTIGAALQSYWLRVNCAELEV